MHCSDIISLKSHVCLSFSVINPVAEWKEIQRFTSLNHHFITLLLTGSKDEERPVKSSQMQMTERMFVYEIPIKDYKRTIVNMSLKYLKIMAIMDEIWI